MHASCCPGSNGLRIAGSTESSRRKQAWYKELTIEDAVIMLNRSEASGNKLIEEARLLVGERMQYCRRNSFDSHRKAFRRGYGYCQQEAHALTELLQKLGFNLPGSYHFIFVPLSGSTHLCSVSLQAGGGQRPMHAGITEQAPTRMPHTSDVLCAQL